MPLVTAEQIANGLKYITANNSEMEVFTDFPSDANTVSEGIYVTRCYQESRKSLVNTLHVSGSSYEIVDRLEMYLIQGQGSPFVDDVLNSLSDFIDNDIFAGYHLREYTIEQLYRKNNESYRIIFSLTRLQTL